MACGLPVVVTDAVDNDKWVEDGTGGLLVPVSDPAALAERLLRLIRDPEQRKRLGAHGRRVIEERNNYYVEMEKVERLYSGVLGR
jgi:glycosyltransferase involved in cell wall biosynthesis